MSVKPPSQRFGPGDIPPQPQRQDSLRDQMRTLIRAGQRLGCYDAVDWIKKAWDFPEPQIGRADNAGSVGSVE